MSRAFSQTEQPSSQDYVSPETMQTYAETLIAEYNSQINQYFSTMKNDFYFYSNSSYTIKSYISSQYGASLWIEPSSVQSFENFNVSQSVETAVFGGDSSVWPLFLEPGHHVIISNLSVELNGHPMVKLSNISSMVFENVRVIQPSFQQHYTCVIMKGNNQTSNWTPEMAKEDAGEILYVDMGVEFSVSEEVRQRYAEPELTALLQNIQSKMKNDSTYTASDWLADMKNIENIAITKYHLTNPSEFINDIIAFLNAKTTGTLPTWPQPTPTPMPTPTPTPIKTIFNRPVNDPYNWLYVACLGGLPVLDFAFFLSIDYWRKKRPSKLAKWALAIPPTVLSFILIDLLYYYPYDYQILSVQSFVIVVLWVLGPILLFKGGKRLSRWLVMKQKASKQTEKNPNQKAEKTSKTKEVN